MKSFHPPLSRDNLDKLGYTMYVSSEDDLITLIRSDGKVMIQANDPLTLCRFVDPTYVSPDDNSIPF